MLVPMLLLTLDLLLIFLGPATFAHRVNPGSDTSLYFREDWKEIPAAVPVTQEHLANPDLVLHRYGNAASKIKKSHHDVPADDPYYIWSGLCEGSWALTLSRKTELADLSRGGRVRWRSRQSGEHYPRLLIRLQSGEFLISLQKDQNQSEWHEFEFLISEVTWHRFDIESFQLLERIPRPDLSSVREIGFTDLRSGRGSQHSTRIDWIEVRIP